MSYFITHPVTPSMGLRESVNAMLSHAAYARHDFGYLPDAVTKSNHEGLLSDYAAILVDDYGVPILAPRITDSAALADLAEVLVGLCNDYPAYNDERSSEIEHERLIDMIEDYDSLEGVSPHEVAFQLHEAGVHVEQSEYGAYVSESDMAEAVAAALASHDAN